MRIEVADEGSDLSAPVVRGDVYASDGHGLFLVQTLSDQWGYLRGDKGTTVWFWLARQLARRSRASPGRGRGQPGLTGPIASPAAASSHAPACRRSRTPPAACAR